MAVLITGMSGFIGSHLGRRLVADGHEVVAILRPGTPRTRIGDYVGRVRIVEADLSQPEAYRKALADIRPERAFHLAWYAKTGRFWTAAENVDCVAMTLSLAKLLSEAGCRQLIGAGTCAEYAWQHGFLSEDLTPAEPSSLYGVAKNGARLVLEAYARQVSMDFAWARLFFPFGPGEAEQRLIPSVTLDLLRGEPARCSHGEQIRDFVFVEDCVGALCKIAEQRLIGTVNVGTGEPTRIRAVVERLAELTGRSPTDVEFGAIQADPAEPPMIVADARKLRSTGWQAEYSLAAGLGKTIEWWRKPEASRG
jgi:nucleoside-diphosphate-sugar epimerase